MFKDLWAGEGLALSLTEGEAVYSHCSTQSLMRVNCLLLTLHQSPKYLQATWEVLPEELLEVRASSLPSCSCCTHVSTEVSEEAPPSQFPRPTVSPVAQLCRG